MRMAVQSRGPTTPITRLRRLLRGKPFGFPVEFLRLSPLRATGKAVAQTAGFAVCGSSLTRVT
jgi:hypothetical protein